MATEAQNRQIRWMYGTLRDLDRMVKELHELFKMLPEGSEGHRKVWINMKKTKMCIRRIEDELDKLTIALFQSPAHCLRRSLWKDIDEFHVSRKWSNSCGVRTLTNTCCPLDQQDILLKWGMDFTRWYVEGCR
jgi:hypothetical protein